MSYLITLGIFIIIFIISIIFFIFMKGIGDLLNDDLSIEAKFVIVVAILLFILSFYFIQINIAKTLG